MLINCCPLKIYLHNIGTMPHSGGTRLRSNADHMGGSRPSMRALHSRPEQREVSRLLDASERGCVIPWRRPSWVRIPPPAPMYHQLCNSEPGKNAQRV